MNQRAIAVLMEGMAPVILGAIAKATAPLIARLDATEKELAALRSALPSNDDIEIIASGAAKKELAGLSPTEPVDLDAVARDVEERIGAGIEAEVTRQVSAVPKAPTAEEVAALIPAPKNGDSITADDVRPMIESMVAGAFATIA